MIAAGSDTTSVFIQSFILLLQAHPEVQRKAQQEIDNVIGADRMPVIDDIKKLPYVQAVINEVGSTRPPSSCSDGIIDPSTSTCYPTFCPPCYNRRYSGIRPIKFST
jgi:hypothetical protein